MVSLNYNAQQGYFEELEGETVTKARLLLRAPHGIPDHARSRVNGMWVGGDYRLRQGDDLEFVVLCGEKAGDLSTEKECLRLGADPKKLEAFRRDPDNRPHWDRFHDQFTYEDATVIPWLQGREKPVVSLNSTCKDALEYFDKPAVLDSLSLAQRFCVVAAYWSEIKGLKAAGVRDAFWNIDHSGYAFPATKRSGYERAKAAIRRGKQLLEKLP